MLGALILIGISTVASSFLVDVSDDEEDDVGADAPSQDDLLADGPGSLSGLDDVLEQPLTGDSETLVSVDRSEGAVTLISEPFADGAATLASDEPAGDDDAGDATELPAADERGGQEITVTREDNGWVPDAEVTHFDAEWVELAAYDILPEAGDFSHADISGFEKGVHRLDIAIFGGDDVEAVDLELAPSEDGADGVLTGNGQLLAILRGVPNADFDDFRISFQDVA